MDFSLTKEQKDIKKAAAEFARGEFKTDLVLDCEANHRFPREIYKKAGELGFIGLDYPEDFGGGGLGIMENVLVIEEFCKADSGFGMALHLAFLPAKIVKIFGTPDQKRKFLSPLIKGDWVSAVSFTEPDHGSDLTRMETTLTELEDGYVLNGTKVFTTNGGYADFFIVLAQEDEAARPGKGMTTILVERAPSSWLGGSLEINEIGGKMGLKMTSSSELVFKNLKLPKENILGERGRGLQNVLDFLDESRIEIGAQALGNCEGAFLKALNHAKKRIQFNKPIMDFQAIGHKLARMWSRVQSLKWLNYYGAWICDHKSYKLSGTVPLFTSVIKHHVPETAKGIIDDAMTVFGGYGYFLDQEVERRYRDNRIVEVYEGTVEVQLNNITRILKKLNPGFLESELL
ncbi:MAG: acyl-CoA dehydrogenase [Deltaproteobacteria bacterium CG_4_8_14_3_um_filter_51_11]|nr:acyl-CoA/acyl-ACP dehydrogenase [bacterium]PIP45652.1 MAG: acyl-CoA dehydrogenase [Deltaproteobacteria bacterium CG23_combo_of_CG06-09_8_20_14_all_51_20]PIX19263.1 MAG: acyl-CoA dehydrogenase [Deltaproteobacteria bacterium CG_4_8_14_3_um_filter_51_11]PIY22536.1 MAG: acyl-CoA dehydrogenase [Deltaproteobacteria bacterium CG_4_10_14_3_um_filter_51_14]PJB34686.1 MAG: acyl-CoA dehydrogenase [Deltaproteobacteria bacterium CG_4_9_14_3_um_filter_51_14]